jgi:hypothetical protein
MIEAPIYTSKCSAKNFWQEYRIYEERVEFHTWLGPWVIPFDQIESVEVSEPLLKAVIHGRFDWKNWPQQCKIDLADFKEHVVLDTNEGSFRTVYFTPDEPSAFCNALEQAIRRFQEEQNDKSE